MSSNHVNLVKLCVGAQSVEQLENWQHQRVASGTLDNPEHVTRSRPRRAKQVLNGGSLYWVFRGQILARQRILALENRLSDDGITRCAIILDPAIIRTFPVPRQPFQGWRYLEPDASPEDLPRAGRAADNIPGWLQDILLKIGVI